MADTEQRDALAAKLLERRLVGNRDEALALADKFLEMDVQYAHEEAEEVAPETVEPDVSAPEVAVVGSDLDSAQNAEHAYAEVVYYEKLKLEPSGRSVFSNARVEPIDEPAPGAQPQQQAARPSGNEAMERLQNTKVDITEFFNVNNLKNGLQQS